MNPSQRTDSGILAEALEIVPCHAQEATHFVLCYKNRIKYIIELSFGTKLLQKTIVPYSKKLMCLMKILPCIPWKMLKTVKLGYFAKVEVHPHIQQFIPYDNYWNILVGTYDVAQKLVFQCFSTITSPCTFIKVGNKGSNTQMQREIDFLNQSSEHTTFEIPAMLASSLLREGAPFNVLVTKEFRGKKIPPFLTTEVYHIAKEIAGPTVIVNDEPHTFSHGDFAPWNIRYQDNKHIVFDWEHCGIRPKGYDTAYFIIITEIALRGANFESAFHIARNLLQELDPELHLNRELILQEFAKTTKTLTF